MPDIGFLELLLVGVVALIVLGPDKLPGAIRGTVKTVRSIRSTFTGIKSEVGEQLRVHELHENLRKAEELGMKDLPPHLQASVDELKALAQSVQPPQIKNENDKRPESD